MQLDITPFGKFSAYRFYDDTTQLSFTIIPEQGALLSDFQLHQRPILDGCPSPASVDFNDWGKSWLLFPFPNRIKDGQYQWQGKSYQFPIKDEQNHHALHGFLHECAFDVINTETTDNQATIALRYNYQGERDYYPFPFVFNVEYQLTTTGMFSVNIDIQNTGTSDLPMGLGWHPYFQLSDQVKDTSLTMLPLTMIGVDQRMIPTGKRYAYDAFVQTKAIGIEVLDNCFVNEEKQYGKLVTAISSRDFELVLWQEVATFPYVQLFTPPHRNSIAIEPMTCNVDAFNNEEGLITLGVNEQWEGAFGFSISKI